MFHKALGVCAFALIAVLSPPAFAERLAFVCQPAEGKALTVWVEKVSDRYLPTQWTDDSTDYLTRLRIDTLTGQFELQASHGFDTDWHDFASAEWSGEGWLAAATVLRPQPRYVARVRVEKPSAGAHLLTFSGELGATGVLVYEYSTFGAASISGVLTSTCTVDQWR